MKKLKEKIYESVKDIAWKCKDDYVEKRGIGLADVLIVLGKQFKNKKIQFSITAKDILFSEPILENEIIAWNLKEDLDGQSPECVKLLTKLLVK